MHTVGLFNIMYLSEAVVGRLMVHSSGGLKRPLWYHPISRRLTDLVTPKQDVKILVGRIVPQISL